MTICAGFRCPEGIVLCADSEETLGDILKRSTPKIVVKSTGHLEGGDVIAPRAVFACAGDGAFIDMAVEKVWRQMNRAKHTQADMIEALEDELISLHQRYWPLYPEKERPTLAMLIGLYVPAEASGGVVSELSLWKTDGPIVTEVQTYDCIGYGLFLGKYIGDRLYSTQLETDKAATLAIYLLEQAKKSVPFCGGEHHVVIMPLPGWICRLSQERVNKVAAAFTKFEEDANRLLLQAPDFHLGETKLMKAWADFYTGLPEYQKQVKDILQKVDDFKLSVPQTPKLGQ